MIREKRMILAAVSDNSAPRRYGQSSNSIFSGPGFAEIPKPMEVDLTFDFKTWVCRIYNKFSNMILTNYHFRRSNTLAKWWLSFNQI